ncbi:hypothetical protein PVAND_005426 [Polypedilum vanderplanki]|uniref:Uncharacterized protein n=1 Tax=Polypedilum vanderplanki TaxID=319348 RepID=A0A9J6C0K1_POLVA|nr:hypothetical protein PVAND_005426 [Polypedilum vanderplanki]
MAFLRSQKFFRFLSVGKNIINFREYDVAHQIQPTNACICSSKNFATASAIKSNQTLDSHLKRLDQDVRKSGRISRRDLEEILEEIRSNKTPTSSQSLLVIRCCGQLVPEEKPEIRTQIVQEIWKTLSNLNVPMDISHYNALLRVYLENEYDFSPTEFLTELQSKGVEPNRVTYQRLISRYCQQGDIDGATQILEFMREKQLPVNENVFNALIMGHSNADDIESAAGILGVMTQAGLEPSADTYTTLLCGFAKKGDVDSINKYIELCGQKEIHLLDKDYLEVAYALAINGHESKITSILKNLNKSFGYNQDAVNVILRLVNKGKIEAAMEILKTMPRSTNSDGESTDAGSFLIRQMIKADRTTEQVLTICNELENSKLHSKPMIIALEESLREGKLEVAKNLMIKLKESDFEIRQHYFWPLFAAAQNEKEILEVIQFMSKEFNMDLHGQTIRDYIIPKLQNQNYEKMVVTLRNMGVTLATACTCVAYTAVKKDDLAGAARIMRSCDAYFSPALFRRPVLFALIAKKDFDSYTKILRSIYENVPRLKTLNSKQRQEAEADNNEGGAIADESAESKIEQLQADILGSFVVDAVINIRHENLEALTKILEGLVNEGLTISSQKAEIIQERVGEKMTNEISTLLGKLTSGELEPVPFEKRQIKMSSSGVMSTESLERLITRLEEKGENTKGMKKQLLIQLIRSKNIEKTEQMIEKLKAEGYTLTNGVYALLFELYAISDKTDDAIKIFNQIKDDDKEFSLDDNKIIKLVQAYVNTNKVDEAIKFLEINKRETIPDSNSFIYNNTCWKILNTLAEKGNVEELNKLFNALIANNYATPNNILLGPLIKVHVLKNEIKEAVDKFEEICTKHRATPWKNELSCKLIQLEDATNLQRITDLSTDVHGEVNSLYDLVFSFIECGRIRQARKILNTPGLKTRAYNRISAVCERYVEEGKPAFLEGLVEATKDLNHIDRSEIYYNLMQTYIKEKSVEKCMEMWTKMQEENILPSDMLLTELAAFFKSENVDVPFAVPNVEKPKKIKKPVTETKKKEPNPVASTDDPLAQFKNDLKTRNNAGIDAFVSKEDNLKLFPKMTVHEKSKMVEALIRTDKIKEATKYVFEMLNENVHPRLNIFRFYLNKLAASGDTDTLEKIGKYLDSEMKKELSYDNRFCHGFVSKGKVDDYLKRLENIIDEAKTQEEIQKAGEIFPRGGAIGLLEQASPDLTKRYENVARKYAVQNILGPINVLWIHHFIKGEFAEADKLWKEYLSAAPRLMFHRIIQVARDQSNTSLIEKLLTLLQNGTAISEGAIGNCYSALIDIQSTKGNADTVLDVVKKAVDAVCLENINTTALNRAKDLVEKSGKTFPFTIPEKKTKKQDSSSSSSSSSDDDVRQKA